jgi:FdhD protein
MEIRVQWPGHGPLQVAVVMRTPGADFELAAGFLLSEGIVWPTEPPGSVAYCLDPSLTAEQRYNVVTATLDRAPRRHPAARSTSVSSACGVCGTESLDEVFTPDDKPLEVGALVDAAAVTGAPQTLREHQQLFAKTGAVHAAGVFEFDGRVRAVREDVGRHNAVDKLLGARLLGAAAYDEDTLLCVSGRMGFDIVSKAVAARLSVIAAVGGPSSLAVALADRAGVTICGFTRAGRFVVYTHPERLRGV